MLYILGGDMDRALDKNSSEAKLLGAYPGFSASVFKIKQNVVLDTWI